MSEFLDNKAQDWFLYFTGTTDCQPCIDLIKEWTAFEESLPQDNKIKIGYVSCVNPLSKDMCKYFGLHTVPTVIRVVDSEYYFMPGTWDKTADNLLKFMNTDYSEAFI